MAKRKRGAQPANRNALKHGLYARHLTEVQALELAAAREISPKDLDEEIALLRVRLADLLDTAPKRFDLLIQGLRTLAHLVSVRHRLSPSQAQDLAGAVANVIEGVAAQLGPIDQP